MNEQEKYDWMVYVSCMTYNHVHFIEDAMNGFAMQETNFPFVCAIVDDASTDGEQGVIKNFLNEHFDLEDKKIVRHEETDDYVLTFARHKTNLNCYFAVLFLKYNFYSIKKSKIPYLAQWREKAKYNAMCEGDDYWIHAEKLQKQVDYLESHPEVGLCYTNFHILTETSGEMRENVLTTFYNEYSYDYTLGDWIRKVDKCYVGPMTWVSRMKLWKTYPSIQGAVDGTFTTYAFFKYISKTYCLLNETTAVYRINRGSKSQATNIEKHFWRVKGLHKQQLLLSEKYLEADKEFTIEYINRVYYANYFRLIYLLDNEEEMSKVRDYKDNLSKVDRILLTLCGNSMFLSLYKYIYRFHYTKKYNLD